MNAKSGNPARTHTRLYLSVIAMFSLLGSPRTARCGDMDQEFLNELARTSADGSLSGIVMMAEQPDIRRMSEHMGAIGLSSRWRRHEYVVRSAQALAARTQADLIATLEEGKAQGVVQSFEAFWVTNMIAVEARPDVFYRIARRDDVGTIYRNKEVDLRPGWDDTPPRGGGGDDAQLPVLPNNLICINIQPAWDQSIRGNGRLIAVFDGGCDGSHQDLASKWRGAQPGHQWFEGWFDPYNHTEFPYDSGDHGTHVTGIAVAEKADGTKIGVAPGAQWMAAGVLIGFNVQKIISCYQWAVDPDGNPSTVSDVPDVINNSWGTTDNCAATYWGAIDLVEAAGIVNVIAVDNSGPGAESVNSPESRAASPTVNYGVGNVDPHQPGYPINQRSGRGPSPCDHASIKPEVTAPGTQIYSTVPGNGYSLKTGCSMAAPHVSGAVAILRQVNPDMPVEEIKTTLMVTSFDRGTTGEDNDYGWGIIDVGAAVEYAKRAIPNYPPVALQTVVEEYDVTLSWSPPETTNPFNPVTYYRVYRASGNEEYPLTPIAEVPSMLTSYSDSDVPFGSWRYVVTALHVNGESGPTNEEVEILPFPPPLNLSAVGDADSVLLSWEHPQPIKPESPVTAYRIFRDAAGDTLGFALLAELPDTIAALAYADRDVPYAVHRYYATAVYDSTESAGTDTVEVTLPLPVPRELAASAALDSLDWNVSLRWLRPQRIHDEDSLLAYGVYRTPQQDPEGRIEVAAFADTADTVRYLDPSVPLGSFVYAVVAIFESDTSGTSNEATVELLDPFPPPRDLAAVGSGDSVLVSWERPANPASPVLLYRLFRDSAHDTTGFAPIAEVPDSSAALAYADRDLPYTTHRYVATAVYDLSESAGPDTVEVTLPLPVPRELAASASADSALAWDVSLLWLRPRGLHQDDPLMAYSLRRAPLQDPGGGIEVAAFADTADTVRYLDPSVPPDSYVYVVHAVFESDTSGPSNQAVVELENLAGVALDGRASSAALWIEPNPSGGATLIRCRTIGGDPLEVTIYDPRGSSVRAFRSVPAPAGEGVIAFSWDGSDDRGRSVSSGTYFVRLRQGRVTATQRVTIVR